MNSSDRTVPVTPRFLSNGVVNFYSCVGVKEPGKDIEWEDSLFFLEVYVNVNDNIIIRKLCKVMIHIDE